MRILGELAERKASGEIAFDRVIVETTGLADPGPVAQTFFVEDDIHARYVLDAIVTVVDARHAQQQLDEHHEAQEQVGFADRILISKSDLVSDAEAASLIGRLRQMNQRATVQRAHFGNADIKELLDIRGFNLDAILEIEPKFLEEEHHEHDDDIKSFVWREERPLQIDKIEMFLSLMVEGYGNDMLRYKGVLNIAGLEHRVVFQGVHMLMGGSPGKSWGANEGRESVMVFIGRNLPRQKIEAGLAFCVDGASIPIDQA